MWSDEYWYMWDWGWDWRKFQVLPSDAHFLYEVGHDPSYIGWGLECVSMHQKFVQGGWTSLDLATVVEEGGAHLHTSELMSDTGLLCSCPLDMEHLPGNRWMDWDTSFSPASSFIPRSPAWIGGLIRLEQISIIATILNEYLRKYMQIKVYQKWLVYSKYV